MSFLSAARIGIDTEGIMSKKRASLNFTPAPIPSPTPIHEATFPAVSSSKPASDNKLDPKMSATTIPPPINKARRIGRNCSCCKVLGILSNSPTLCKSLKRCDN